MLDAIYQTNGVTGYLVTSAEYSFTVKLRVGISYKQIQNFWTI